MVEQTFPPEVDPPSVDLSVLSGKNAAPLEQTHILSTPTQNRIFLFCQELLLTGVSGLMT